MRNSTINKSPRMRSKSSINIFQYDNNNSNNNKISLSYTPSTRRSLMKHADSTISPSNMLSINEILAFPALSQNGQYRDLQTLEQSIFGCVKLGIHIPSKKKVAIKISCRSYSEKGTAHTGSQCIEETRRECFVMRHINAIKKIHTNSQSIYQQLNPYCYSNNQTFGPENVNVSIDHDSKPGLDNLLLPLSCDNQRRSPSSTQSFFSIADTTDIEESHYDPNWDIRSNISSNYLTCSSVGTSGENYISRSSSGIPMDDDTYSKLGDGLNYYNLCIPAALNYLNNQSHRNEYIETPGLKHIVKLYDELSDDWFHYVITEYVPHGDLFNLLVSQPDQKLSEPFCRIIFEQLVDAVDHLHRNNTVHLDLSLENACVEIDPNGKVDVKLIDFGLATIHPNYDRTGLPSTIRLATSLCQTDKDFICEGIHVPQLRPGKQGYMSYELSSGQNFDAKKNDIFALGVCLYTLLTGKPPFRSTTFADTWFAVIWSGSFLTAKIRNQPSAQVYTHLSPEALDLINSIITPEKHRLNLEQIKNHPWMLKKD